MKIVKLSTVHCDAVLRIIGGLYSRAVLAPRLRGAQNRLPIAFGAKHVAHNCSPFWQPSTRERLFYHAKNLQIEGRSKQRTMQKDPATKTRKPRTRWRFSSQGRPTEVQEVKPSTNHTRVSVRMFLDTFSMTSSNTSRYSLDIDSPDPIEAKAVMSAPPKHR